MKTIKKRFLIPAALLALSTIIFQPSTLLAQGTAFTYQGLLNVNGSPANGNYDVTFAIFNASSGPAQVGVTVTNSPTLLSNGLFTVTLDFGPGIFTGPARWLEIGSRPTGNGAFVILAGRQELTPAPYAIFAENASNLGGQPVTAFAPASGSSAYVAKAGDTMTGGLTVQNYVAAQGQVSGDGFFTGAGVYGTSSTLFLNSGTGVWGENTGKGIGVKGTSNSGLGVFGRSEGGGDSYGVFGSSGGTAGASGVYGVGTSGAVGVIGASQGNDGVSGISTGEFKSGVYGFTAKASGYGGSFYNSAAGGISLRVYGNASVDVLTINGADVAEPFQVTTRNAPKGSVMVIDDENPGQLKLSDSAYDKRVAGILSGANGVRAGICLSQQGFNEGGQNVALSGRVYVLADASNSPIKPGDLLTTSSTPGHAMKVTDYAKAQGAILGKAMSGLKEGKGMVLVLVTLQ